MWSNGLDTTERRTKPPGNLLRTLNMLPTSPPNFIINILINLAHLINPQAPSSPITSYCSSLDPNFPLFYSRLSEFNFVLILLHMRLTQILSDEIFGWKCTLRLRVCRLGG